MSPLIVGVPAQSQLTSIVWQDGSVRRYHHEDGRWPQAVTGITDEAGVRYGSYAYDAQGRVTRSELSGGAERLDFAYASDASGKPTTTVTDYTGAGGAATNRTYTFTDIGNVRYPVNLTAPCSLCGSTRQASTYDASGNTTRQIAHDGSVTFIAYDSKGRETERASFAGQLPDRHHAPGAGSGQQHRLPPLKAIWEKRRRQPSGSWSAPLAVAPTHQHCLASRRHHAPRQQRRSLCEQR